MFRGPLRLSAFFFALAYERTFIKRLVLNVDVTGPENTLFPGASMHLFLPGNFTGWSSERVKPVAQSDCRGKKGVNADNCLDWERGASLVDLGKDCAQKLMSLQQGSGQQGRLLLFVYIKVALIASSSPHGAGFSCRWCLN